VAVIDQPSEGLLGVALSALRRCRRGLTLVNQPKARTERASFEEVSPPATPGSADRYVIARKCGGIREQRDEDGSLEVLARSQETASLVDKVCLSPIAVIGQCQHTRECGVFCPG
jgi:hypothetical protein